MILQCGCEEWKKSWAGNGSAVDMDVSVRGTSVCNTCERRWCSLTPGADLDFCLIIINKRKGGSDRKKRRTIGSLSTISYYTIWRMKPWNWSKNLTSIMDRFSFVSLYEATLATCIACMRHDDVNSMQLWYAVDTMRFHFCFAFFFFLCLFRIIFIT